MSDVLVIVLPLPFGSVVENPKLAIVTESPVDKLWSVDVLIVHTLLDPTTDAVLIVEIFSSFSNAVAPSRNINTLLNACIISTLLPTVAEAGYVRSTAFSVFKL